MSTRELRRAEVLGGVKGQTLRLFKCGTTAVPRSPDGLRFTQFTAGGRRGWRRSLLRDAILSGMRHGSICAASLQRALPGGTTTSVLPPALQLLA